MTEDEGLSLREAVGWCGGSVTVREVNRLCGLTAVSRAVETDASDERQAGPAKRRLSAAVPVEADASAEILGTAAHWPGPLD
jgi:hypothetical protein